MVFSAFLSKPFNSTSQKGQAVTEYLLILVVVVSIALGVMYQLNQAFKKYVESYFGDYIACLLESGELPSLGGESGASAEGCNAVFEPFSLKNGRPLVASGGKGAGKKSGNSGSAKFVNSPKVSKTKMSTFNGERAGAGGDGAVSSVKPASRGSIGPPDSGSRITLREGRARSNGQFRVNGKFSSDDDKKDSKATRRLDAKKSKNNSPKKLSFDGKRQTASAGEEKDVDFSMGDWLRFLLIAGIIIAIIFVLGGQLMQVRRNQNVE